MNVVGYVPYWAGAANAVPYSKLTHVNYAFVLPSNDSGSLAAVPNQAKLRDIVTRAHRANVKVLISVYGWLNEPELTWAKTSIRNPSTRATLVRSIANIVNSFNLDGADIDLEYPTGVVTEFPVFLRDLRQALPGKLVTAAVIASANSAAGKAITPEAMQQLDFVNVMTYDGGEPHANYDWSVGFMRQWLARFPARKLCFGLPFYSRAVGSGGQGKGTTYRALVAQDPGNADRDIANGQAYNGRPTIRRKTQWSKDNGCGVMYWEDSQDTKDGTSLATAIDGVVRSAPADPWWGWFPGRQAT